MSIISYTIPDHWIKVKLEEVINRISNGTTAKQNKEGIGLPVTRIETISKETIDLERVRHISNPSPDFISKYKLEYHILTCPWITMYLFFLKPQVSFKLSLLNIAGSMNEIPGGTLLNVRE